MEITSLSNNLVKETVKLHQKKYRSQTGEFLLEGYKAVKEAFDFGIEIKNVFVLKGKEEKFNFVKDKLISANEAVLKKIGTTDSFPEVVAVGIQKTYDTSLLKSAKKILLLENIKDVGNLGTILRTATAFEIDAVVIYGNDTVDLYNPKCVRASVGNLWKIPVFYIKNIVELRKYFDNFNRIATLPRTNNYLKDFSVKTPVLVMFGSEADGLSDELIEYSTDSVKIEMSKDVESLNLSISCAIVLYKLMD